jgi:hypothetical protein
MSLECPYAVEQEVRGTEPLAGDLSLAESALPPALDAGIGNNAALQMRERALRKPTCHGRAIIQSVIEL